MSRGNRVAGGLAVAVVCLTWLVPGAPAFAGAPTGLTTVAAPDSLTGTLIPALAEAGSGQLAVHWDGHIDAQLTATLRTAGQPATTLLAGEPLREGVNLHPLAAELPAGGSLELRATGRAGEVLASWSSAVTDLLDESGFGWESWFHGPGLDTGDSAAGSGGASALAVWDDGSGPALYVGGWTITAGGREVNRIARWDGAEWSPLTGPAGPGVWMDGSGNANVKALAVYDGALIVAGYFDNAGGVSVNNLARWDGTGWSPLAEGVTGGIGVETLAVHDGQLFAGGSFTAAGSAPAARVASWDGTGWSPLASGMASGSVFALASFDGDLYAGGSFTDAGGVEANRVARWDGTGWSSLGAGTNQAVRSFGSYDGELIAGGLFTTAGGVSAGRIARWDGHAWAPLGAGLSGPGNPTVLTMASFEGALVAAGTFQAAAGETVNYLARWDGQGWSPLSGPGGTGTDNGVSAIVEFDGALIAGSNSFREAGGVVVNYIARWDGTEWSALAGDPARGLAAPTSGIATVDAMTIWDGALVVAGSFARAGGQRIGRVARWDGATWSPLAGSFGSGTNGDINALAVYRGELVVGGRFSLAGGLFVDNIARFDGQEWAPVAGAAGVGADFTVEVLTVYDGALIAAGNFLNIGGVAAAHIAQWDGADWSPLGTGTDRPVYDLTIHDGKLVAGGAFADAGGVAANQVARWDGSGWAPVGGGMNGTVSALTDHAGVLVAGGSFTQADGVLVNRVARFQDGQWSALPGAAGPGVDGPVNALGSYAGDLFAGGRFTAAGGVPVSGLARWDGSGWSPVAGEHGEGVGGVVLPNVSALLAFDSDGDGPVPPKLLVGGAFHTAGGLASWGIAQYGPTAPLTHLTVSPPVRDFGSVRTGERAGPAAVTLTATGNRPVEVSEVPAPETPFVVGDRDCPAAPFQLAPAESCTISYEYAPATAGAHRQILPIGTPAGQVSLELAGTGLAGPPGIEVDPATLEMAVPAGGTGSQPVSISNSGEAPLHWEIVDGDLAADESSALGAIADGAAGSNSDGVAGGADGEQVPGRAGSAAPGTVGGGEPAPEPSPPDLGAVPSQAELLTHSASMAILPDHAVSCVNLATGHTRGSQFLRTFRLADFGIQDDFLVTDVSFGVQQAHPELPVTVNLYTLEGPFQYANLVPIASRSVTIAPDQRGGLVTVPVRAVLPAAATLVVEIAAADLLGTGWFFPGTNDHGESAPSYFASPACGIAEPTPMANVGFGFPDVHLVMSVTGRDPVECGQPAWLAADPASGTTASGSSSEVSVAVDATGLTPGTYQAWLCVDSDDPARTLTVVPLSLTVAEPDPGPDPRTCTETITGVHAGPLTVAEGVTCLAAGAQVLGEVNVLPGAGLIATAAVVQGPVSAVGATVVELSFSQVTGPVLISGGSHSVVLFANQVTGGVTVLAANTGGNPVTITGNTVIGSLACFDNAPAPVHHGLPNTATAGKLGQCAAL